MTSEGPQLLFPCPSKDMEPIHQFQQEGKIIKRLTSMKNDNQKVATTWDHRALSWLPTRRPKAKQWIIVFEQDELFLAAKWQNSPASKIYGINLFFYCQRFWCCCLLLVMSALFSPWMGTSFESPLRSFTVAPWALAVLGRRGGSSSGSMHSEWQRHKFNSPRPAHAEMWHFTQRRAALPLWYFSLC